MVLFPNVSPDGVEIAIRRVLNDWLGTRPDGAALTASIGIAERQADAIDDWASLIKLADKRMYQAKTSGKARCKVSDILVLLPEA